MENKNTKYLLFLAIIAIWGLFGYRLYERTKPKEGFRPAMVDDHTNLQKVGKADSFSLLLAYKDPFLSTFTRPAPKVQNPQPQKQAPKKVEKKPSPPPKPFPEIVYKGNLKLKTGKTVALVAIEDKNAHLETGESFKDVLVTKIYEDSIKVSFFKEEKTILKVRL